MKVIIDQRPRGKRYEEDLSPSSRIRAVESVNAAAVKFLEERGSVPGYVLVGWRTFLCLSFEPLAGCERCRDKPLSRVEQVITPVGTVRIVVDDSTPELVKALPKSRDVRYGRYG
jgi:hypothetical protein